MSLFNWVNNLDESKIIGEKGYDYAIDRYSYNKIISQIEKSLISVFDKNKNNIFNPLSIDIYKKRKYIYFLRYYMIRTITIVLIKIFGQQGTRILPKVKQLFIFKK